MELRNYRKKALEEAHCWFNKETGYPLIVLPTGAGKTVVFATLIKQLYEEDPTRRFLIIAHRQELISQAVDKTSGLKHQLAYLPPAFASLTTRPLLS